MKTIIKTFILCIISISVLAQAPQSFNYQAVLRNDAGEPKASQDVTIRIDIVKGSAGGSQVFTETHNTATDEFGLVNLQIGSIQSLEVVDWSADDYFIQVIVDGTIMGTTQLLSVPYALHAKTVEETNIKTYEIGDEAHGGIVFYVEPCGTKGLVAATEDQSTGIKWRGGGTHYATMARGDEVYAGKMNTSIIIAVHSAKDDLDDHAALLAANYTGGDFGDWYLPSGEELLLMYNNLHTQGLGGFADEWYWSSSEEGATGALSFSFLYGATSNWVKASEAYVRAVRAF